MQMKNKAQAGLAYLVTYGWALVLIATVIGAMVFVFFTPADVSFTSSDPGLLVAGSSVVNGSVTIKLQNISGGTITVTGISFPAGYSDCTINGLTPGQILTSPLQLLSGQDATVLCEQATDTTQAIQITYKDYAGLEQNANITGSSGDAGGCVEGMENCCGNSVTEAGNINLTCLPGASINAQNMFTRGIYVNTDNDVTVSNCDITINGTGTIGAYIGDGLGAVTLSNNTVSGSGNNSTGIYLRSGFGERTLSNNDTSGISSLMENHCGIYTNMPIEGSENTCGKCGIMPECGAICSDEWTAC